MWRLSDEQIIELNGFVKTMGDKCDVLLGTRFCKVEKISESIFIARHYAFVCAADSAGEAMRMLEKAINNMENVECENF